MNDKNIVILAGGISSRMKKPLANNIQINEKLISEADSESKSMIGVGDDQKPFLDYLLHNIQEAGFQNVLIVIGEKDKRMKDYYLGNKLLFPKINFLFATQYIPKGRIKPFGTADALYQGLRSVPEWKKQSFVVLNSDNLYSVKALKTLLMSNYTNALIDYDSRGFDFDDDRVKQFAVINKSSEGFLIDIVEKPEPEMILKVKNRNGYIGVSMNIFKLNYKMIYNILENCPVHPQRNEKELPTAVKILINSYPSNLFCYPFSEHVPDLTNKEDIVPVQKYLKTHFAGLSSDKRH